MNIIHAGVFLGEGLRKLGHTVFPLALQAGRSLEEQASRVCGNPDLVLLELTGTMPTGLELHACPFRLAAFCMDTPINEFWLRDALLLFDDVFVDQRSSVAGLQEHDLRAVWLPLCVQEGDFRGPREKRFPISFVGRRSPLRLKRTHLLRHVAEHHSLNLVEGVGTAAMQDIFAASRIVLNENFFSGLTLRVLQGLASGSLVLTEADGDGVDAFFQDGAHLVCYRPHTLLRTIAEILERPAAYEAIAARGQELCRRLHTSEARAGSFMRHIEARDAWNARRGGNARRLAGARAEIRLCLRFGGSLERPVATLTELLAARDETTAIAACELGDIHARGGLRPEALTLYGKAVEEGYPLPSLIKIAMLHLHDGRNAEAAQMLLQALAHLHEDAAPLADALHAAERSANPQAELLFAAARIYRACGAIFEPGFFKQREDLFPDTALETALLAWDMGYSAQVLDFMLDCAKACGVEGELLPQLLSAIENGLAADRHIARAAELAERYYYKEAARCIAGQLNKSMKKR